jgi:hypothetical protein
LWYHEHHAELGFVYAVVKAGEQVGGPVADQAGEGEAEECANEGACIPSRSQDIQVQDRNEMDERMGRGGWEGSYMYPVSTSPNQSGGPSIIAASVIPIRTVKPIRVP